MTASSVSKSDKRLEFGLGFSDKLLRTSLMMVWELIKQSWCPSSNADSILRTTQDVQRELNSDCNLRDLNIIHNLMTTASKSNGEDKVELPGWGPEDWVKPGSCLAEVCGLEGRISGGLDCVKTLGKQHDIAWEHYDQVENRNGTDCRLPCRNQGESSNCTRILQHVWFFRVTIESRTKA